jgi:hypothetical protein
LGAVVHPHALLALEVKMKHVHQALEKILFDGLKFGKFLFVT